MKIKNVFAVLTVLLTSHVALAQYNYHTGRFHQPDPLGTGPRVVFSDNGPRFVGTHGPTLPRPGTPAPIYRNPLPHSPNPVRVNQTTNPVKNPPTQAADPQSQYADGMNLYQYTKSNPVNNVDPYGLQASHFIHLPNLYPKRKRCGTCGTDVTAALNNLRNKIIEDFNNLSMDEQIAKCTGMWGGDSWDIDQLYDPGLLPNKGCATGDCADTVQVNGNCYHSRAVNYYMYGTMHSLCSIAPEKTVRIGMLWPLLFSGDAKCKNEWASAGVYGKISYVNCSSYEFCKPCSNKADKLDYKWERVKIWPFEK